MNELVSVIMPSYNTAQYISNSINSVLSQTYTNWELLIVDDCSTDNSLEIINSFKDQRIRVLQNEKNSGAAISRNFALREAKGKWIAFLDSDDIWAKDKLQKQIKFMEENGYAFTYTDYQTILNGKAQPYVNIAPNVITKKKMYDYCYFFTSTVIYNRDKVGLIQIADLKKNNDYAMWLQIIEKSKAYRLPECLSFYIKHSGSISTDRFSKLIKSHYVLFRKGMNKGAFTSCILTINNLFHGLLKKIFYKKSIEKYGFKGDEDVIV